MSTVVRAGAARVLVILALLASPSLALAQSVRLDQYRMAETPEDGFVVSRPSAFGHLRFGARADARSDVYSAGVVLYELIAARPPFVREGRASLIRAHALEEVPPIGELRQDLDVEAAMGMSPLFGKVVSLAFTDGEAAADEQRVTALVVPPEGRERDAWPDWIRPMSEADLLRAFWALAAHADVVVSFHGFGFDVPFLVARSLVHEVPARVDLLSQRYRARPHLDLYRVLTNGERPLGPSGLEPWCWALGIDSPKNDMDGSMVASTYAQGDVERIALYNAADVRATAALYRRVREKVLAFRQDW